MSKAYISAALRRLVYDHACEYCCIPEIAVLVSHEVDHIIAEKHGGSTNADNLALSCTVCNKYKGSDLASIDPATGEIVRLYHPRRDQWQEHFQLQGGNIVPLTPIGRVTVRLLQFTRSERQKEPQVLIEAGVLNVPD